MNRNKFVPQIPYGTRDFLPSEAKRKRTVENALALLFAKWGYDEVVTPTFEYLETLSVTGDFMEDMFKFIDKNNRILVLRPDMTTPMTRVAATRLREHAAPLRLFYLTNVFRHEQAQAGRQCEFYQAGVELLGAAGPVADAEVIALSVQAMLEAGLEQFQISLGQVDYIQGLMKEYTLSPEQRQQVKRCMITRDLVGLQAVLTELGLDQTGQDKFRQIPLLHGKEEVLEKAYGLVNNDISRSALDNLSDIYELLKTYGVEKYVNFDLGIIRDFDYYTGMVFEGYTPGLGFPLCGGGRYDNMLSSFGTEGPATGFALGIERILLAQERQGIAVKPEEKDIYVAWSEGSLPAAIKETAALRQKGYVVEMSLVPQTADEAVSSQLERACGKLMYIK